MIRFIRGSSVVCKDLRLACPLEAGAFCSVACHQSLSQKYQDAFNCSDAPRPLFLWFISLGPVAELYLCIMWLLVHYFYYSKRA